MSTAAAARRPLWTRRRNSPRPVWSVRSLTVLAIFVTLAVAIPTMIFGQRSLLERAEWVTVIMATMLWSLLFVGLYFGARVKKDEPLPEFTGGIDGPEVSFDGVGDFGSALGAADDLVGAVMGLIYFLLLGVMLIFLLPTLISGLLYVIVLLVAAMMWIFRRALRQVFVRGPRCRGRLGPSVAYASGYTLLYSGWLLAILLLADAYAR